MKKKTWLYILFFLLLAVCGCKPQNKDKEGMGSMEDVTLTESEEKLLCDLYMNEEDIREGKLKEYQWKCLKQIRFGKEYLEEKYPGKSFEFLTCNPMNKTNSVTSITFYEQEDETREYNLVIEEEEESYTAADNYYGILIREAYDEAVTQCLFDAGIEPCVTYTTFDELKGAETDGKLTPQDIFAMGSSLGRSTEVFLDSDSSRMQEVQKVMKENNLYGSYTIYYMPGLSAYMDTGTQCSGFVRENRKNMGIGTDLFQCFD